MSKAGNFIKAAVNEIRNVRNFWVSMDVEGYSKRVEAGPRSKDGTANVMIYVRDGGSSVKALDISCIPRSDGSNYIRVEDGKGNTVYEKRYDR